MHTHLINHKTEKSIKDLATRLTYRRSTMKQHSLNNGFSQLELPQHAVGPFSRRSNTVCGMWGSISSNKRSLLSKMLCRARYDCSTSDNGVREVQLSNRAIVRGRLRTHFSFVTNTCGRPWFTWLSDVVRIVVERSVVCRLNG